MKPIPDEMFTGLSAYRVQMRHGRTWAARRYGAGPSNTKRKRWWSRTWQAEYDGPLDRLGGFRAWTRSGALRKAVKARLREEAAS